MLDISKNLFLILSIIFFIIVINSLHKKEKFLNYSKTNFVFWTGGYDSTFRICELLIVYKSVVQPIYVSYNLDSEKETDFWVRQNRKQETLSMETVRNALYKLFPYTKNLLKKTIIIDKNIEKNNYDKAFNKLGLWPNKRRIHQYGHLGRISYVIRQKIDIGVLGVHDKSLFIQFLTENLIEKNNNMIFNLKKNHPLYYLSFPLFNKSKKDLCQSAKKHKFDGILRLTWSCWFPKNGTPCNECPMCIERFNCI